MAKEYVIKRKVAYKNGNLPYSFSYKMKNAFIGKECPICHNKMGVASNDKNDPVKVLSPMPTIQHNLPIVKGGKHEIDNISVICKRCNLSIRDKITGSLNNKEVKEVWNNICQQTIIKNTIG